MLLNKADIIKLSLDIQDNSTIHLENNLGVLFQPGHNVITWCIDISAYWEMGF